MTTPNDVQTTPRSDDAGRPCTAPGRRCGGPRGGALRLVAFLAVAGLGFLAGQAFAHEGGRGGFFGPMAGMDIDPERAEARIERLTKHLAVEADATPEQQEKLAAIAKAAVRDLAGPRERMQAHRRAMMAAFSAPTIDRAKIESMRSEHLKDIDAMSRRLTQAMAEAAEVLTPEQRQTLAQHMAERQKHRRHDGRGGMGGMGGMGMGR